MGQDAASDQHSPPRLHGEPARMSAPAPPRTAATAGASSTTVRCPEVRVEATKRLRVRVDRRLAGPLPGLLCLAGRLA
jgi:hypothetical protein